jgi:[lysine-biosynthesis-protein LysW]--L-2-aminoadipate ligase
VSALRSIRFGLLITYLREEEKLILKRARARGLDVTTLLERQLVLDLNARNGIEGGYPFDCVVDRCVAHLPADYTLKVFERWGIPTINSAETTATCDDKARCSLALEAYGVPTPKTMVAFSVESALDACERLGFPAVLKPVTGSWGRLLAKVNGPGQARLILEQKKELGSIHHAIFYVQEYIEKPGRDIRAFVVGDRVVAASYRTSEHWITNTARGGQSISCPVTPEIEEMALRACRAVGARWAGVDLMETDRGLVCIEVNSGGEFHGLMTTTDVDIADEIVREALAAATHFTSSLLATEGVIEAQPSAL